jgi:hypothetical protein
LIFAFGEFDGMFKMEFIASTTTSLIEKKMVVEGFSLFSERNEVRAKANLITIVL